MAMNRYDKGDVPRVTGAFRNQAGTLTDPASVSFKYRAPGGTTVTLVYGVDGALVKDSAGTYHVDINANAAGVWPYRWESTGAGQAAAEGEFVVERSAFS